LGNVENNCCGDEEQLRRAGMNISERQNKLTEKGMI
jgi:hypothetical protein